MGAIEALPFVLNLDDPSAVLEVVGGKGASLRRMVEAGLPVPLGFHVTTRAYSQFVNENQIEGTILAEAGSVTASDPSSFERASEAIQRHIVQGRIPDALARSIQRVYAELGPGDPAVAVRSSATAEDLPELSFAGQQETYLNVRGEAAVLEAVKHCWASLWTARAIGYRAQHQIPSDNVSIAVVVQRLVAADAAGILFTANPVTGSTEQIIINAAWGLGEAIVSGHVSPDTIVVNKQNAAIESQDISEKEWMTVRLPEGTGEAPVPAEKRRAAVLNPAQITRLAQLGRQIEDLYQQPMDIEWALDGEKIYILQARPITAMPEPQVSIEWLLPREKGKYARSSVIELLPDPLSPLFATLALPIWNEAMRNLGAIAGIKNSIDFFDEMKLLTINDYAYYDYGFSAGQSLRLLPLMPRFLRELLPSAQRRWEEGARPRYADTIRTWEDRDLSNIPAAQLLGGVRDLVKSAAEHYLTIQSGILPVAGMSELFFTQLYNRLIKQANDPPAFSFLLGFDSAPIQAEKSLYDLATWARTRMELSEYLLRTGSTDIAVAYRSESAPIDDAEGWGEFTRRFTEHLKRFGHAIYDLDFAKAVPADDPAPLLETVKYFLTGEGQSPYERQAGSAIRRDQAIAAITARLKGLRLRWFNKLLRWAQRYGPLREDALADVGLGWPTARRMLREIGKRLIAAGAITDPDDVYWFRIDELEGQTQKLDRHLEVQDYRGLVRERKAVWEREHRVVPPVTLPIKGGARIWGIDWSRWMPARTDQAQGETIKGIGASPGRVEGVARVIHGSDEFDQMKPGDILVAKITTPAWTPLFTLASGVVTDVGGILSHSSIVAREYHIPAVLGTGVATERIRSGQRITVDGDQGVVVVKDEG